MKLPDISLQTGLAVAGASCLVLVIAIKGGLLAGMAVGGVLMLASAAIVAIIRHS